MVMPSPSSGLKYKMLRLPPAFRLDAADASATASPRQAYSMRPSPKAPLGQTRLGLLPVAAPDYPRTANVILPEGHPVWSLQSGAAVLGWLGATFPHLPIDQIISDDEAADFAAAKPGAFPAPTYTPRQFLLLPGSAVCLVGDAVHAFPPDIGQGVNAALQDVMLLQTALVEAAATASSTEAAASESSKPPADASVQRVRRALPDYGAACAPEAEAVCRIAQIGFPYQCASSPPPRLLLASSSPAPRLLAVSPHYPPLLTLLLSSLSTSPLSPPLLSTSRHSPPLFLALRAPPLLATHSVISHPHRYPITNDGPLPRFAWFANFLLRTFLLSKLMPRLFSPAAIVLVQRPQLSYAQVWSTAAATTRRLRVLAATIAAGLLWPLMRRLLLA